MNQNPYVTLGVSESATDEEIKKAYKALARKYHPDVNPSKEAAAKMVEINCAYDEIKKLRETGQTYSSYSSSFNQGYSSAYASNTNNAYSSANADELYRQVAAAINSGYIHIAFNILQNMSYHDARWYYYNSVIYAKTGYYSPAKEFINEALRMDPDNAVYQNFKVQIDNAETNFNNDYPYSYSRVVRISPLFKVFFYLFIISLLISCITGIGRMFIGG